MNRRNFVGRMAGVAVGAGMIAGKSRATGTTPLSGGTMDSGIRHSVCKWCYRDLSVEELAAAASSMGMHSVELLDPDDWQTVINHDLICAMANGPGGIEKGFNHVENHEWLVPGFEKRLQEVADAGFPNVICFSGNREGMDDEEGLENCVIGLKKILPTAERLGVTVCMELLNSKVNHPDYMCDYTEWGVRLCNRVGSERFKLLYDIYHMQIMEGDVIRTIRDNSDYIAHYHTGGNPGRNEIDETQELNYRAITRAILETGFEGYVAQEFIPTRDPLTSLREAVEICTV